MISQSRAFCSRLQLQNVTQGFVEFLQNLAQEIVLNVEPDTNSYTLDIAGSDYGPGYTKTFEPQHR